MNTKFQFVKSRNGDYYKGVAIATNETTSVSGVVVDKKISLFVPNTTNNKKVIIKKGWSNKKVAKAMLYNTRMV